MKRGLVGLISLGCALAMGASLLAGCSKPAETKNSVSTVEETTKPAEPVKLKYLASNGGRNQKDDNPVVKEIEKMTDTSLEVTLIPDAEFSNRFNVMVAAGEVPDIVKTPGYDCFKYIPQGVFAELDGLIEKYGANLKKNIPAEAWDKVKYNGKLYAVPSFNAPGKYNFVVRQDWLDNLGLKAPANLDELTDMLKKFTYNDPDKNGKDDTYGYSLDSNINTASATYANPFGAIFGIFGAMPGQFYENSGKAYAASIMPEYKEAIEYITMLYKDEKVIDPDFFILKRDQARQFLVQGRSGSLTAWWSLTPQVFMEQMKMSEVNPNAKWSIIPPSTI